MNVNRQMRVPTSLFLLLCAWSVFLPAGAQEKASSVPAPAFQPVLKQWRTAGGTWHVKAEAGQDSLIGEVAETTRGFAVAEDAPFSQLQTLETTLTPTKHIGASWSAGGLCAYRDLANYWRLALVESPDGAGRYAELTLLRDGQGVGEQTLRVLSRSEQTLNWKWNTAYRLRLTLAPDSIMGEALDSSGVLLWHIAYSLEDASLLHVGWPAVGVQGMQAAFGRAQQRIPTTGLDAQTVDCKMLQERVSAPHWLSLPDSRLVINPTMSSAPAVPPSLAPSLPLNLAYYVGETPSRLPCFWAWQANAQNAPPVTVTTGPAADFTPAASAHWTGERAIARFANGQLRLSVASVPFGSLTTETVVDLEQTPFLLAQVPRCAGQWALKVNSGQQATDTYVQADTSQTGNFCYDLRALTGWHGKRAFKLILFVIGLKDSSATFSSLRFAGTRDTLPALTSQETLWFPHQITTQARTADGDMQADSTIGLADAQTVVQKLHIRRANAQSLVLTGQIGSGTAHWDEARRMLIVEGEGYRAVIAPSRAARWLGGFASGLERLAGRNGLPTVPANGVWALAFDNVQTGEDISVAARFAPVGDNAQSGLTELMNATTPFATTQGVTSALDAQAEAWNQRLNSVPHPLDFTLRALEARGATPQAIRRTYYKAWVFLFANILPPLPENGFPYPQMPCGKASLWDEGATHARASSQWESFIAMQFAARVAPDTAWQAYEGLLSLVAPDGSLGGEGLPSRHAETAWILYAATGDKARLSKTYPALKRLLLWKAANPRWLYKGSTPPDEKDSEFVVHALMDMRYAQRIADVLNMPDETIFWQNQITALSADYHKWFWTRTDGPSEHTYRLFRASAGKREEPDRSWNLQGLVLPPALLTAGERDTFLRLFRASLNRATPFLIGQLAGFPKYNFTQRGVWQYGTPDEAALMAESALRDVTLAGQFSENYFQNFPPAPTGVTPSIFGAAQILDGGLWHNGVIGEGVSLLAPLPGAVGVMNLRVRASMPAAGTNTPQTAPVDVLFDSIDKQVTLQGSGLKAFRLPPGFQNIPLPDGTLRWRGKYPAQGGLSLNFLP